MAGSPATGRLSVQLDLGLPVARSSSLYGTHLRTRELCYQCAASRFIPQTLLILSPGRSSFGPLSVRIVECSGSGNGLRLWNGSAGLLCFVPASLWRCQWTGRYN